MKNFNYKYLQIAVAYYCVEKQLEFNNLREHGV